MTAPTDVETFLAFLARCRHRLTVGAAIDGSAIGSCVAAGVIIIAWLAGWSMAPTAGVATASVGAACACVIWRTIGSMDAAAHAVERRHSACQNIVVTAAELLRDSDRIRPDIASVVYRHAVRVIDQLDVRELFPLGRAMARLGAAVIAIAAAGVMLSGRATPALLTGGVIASDVVAIDRIDVTITSPAYTRQPLITLQDPAEVSAITGSRLHISVATRAGAVTLSTVETCQALARDRTGNFAGDLTAVRDGYLLVEPAATSGSVGARRLIGLAITPDQPPSVRITKPGRDLFVTTADLPLLVEVAASDDFGLASLRLSYTKVNGSDENFTFQDGEVPLRVIRDGDNRWTAAGTLAVPSLTLTPGDTVVYRGLALDRRPGAPIVESDAFIVQIVTRERADFGGFAIDDEMSRYAISQQMIIIKTERLVARRSLIDAGAFADEALSIAAEQRRLRAEFIFVIGGEMEDTTVAGDEIDETGEAAREEEIAAGRLRNPGFIDVMFATRHMSHAATALTVPDMTAGLRAERAALASLQRAFSKNRYLLRALAAQQRLDLSRRLSGKLADLVSEARPAAAPTASPRTIALRRALAGVAALAGRTAYAGEHRTQALALSEAILRIDPAATVLRQIAAAMADAATAMSSGHAPAARTLLDRAALGLASVVRAGAPDALAVPGADVGRLHGDLADARRRVKEPR